MVLRGFNLYWFRADEERKMKDSVIIPTRLILPESHRAYEKKGKKCFSFDDASESASTRDMIFEDQTSLRDFKFSLMRMCNYKLYIESNIRKNQHIDSTLAQFLVQNDEDERDSIMFEGISLKERTKLECFMAYT